MDAISSFVLMAFFPLTSAPLSVDFSVATAVSAALLAAGVKTFFSYNIVIFVKNVKACMISVLFFRPALRGWVGKVG